MPNKTRTWILNPKLKFKTSLGWNFSAGNNYKFMTACINKLIIALNLIKTQSYHEQANDTDIKVFILNKKKLLC